MSIETLHVAFSRFTATLRRVVRIVEDDRHSRSSFVGSSHGGSHRTRSLMLSADHVAFVEALKDVEHALKGEPGADRVARQFDAIVARWREAIADPSGFVLTRGELRAFEGAVKAWDEAHALAREIAGASATLERPATPKGGRRVPGGDPAERARRFRRGELDEKAATTLALNPGWSNDQVATFLGCNVKSLSNPALRRFQEARRVLKSARERYQGVSQRGRARGGRRDFEDDDE